MRIVYLLRDHTNPGGIERIVAKKANYLVNKGYDVHIVVMTMKGESSFFEFNPKISFHNLDIVPRKSKSISINAITEYLNELKPDITISTGVEDLIYSYEVQDGSKKIFEYHFAMYKRKFGLAAINKYFWGKCLNHLYYSKKRYIARQYDRFVVLTNEDREDWGALGNIYTIHNPLSFIPESSSELTEKRVIAVGRYTQQKGFDYLITIWSKVSKQFPDWKLSIFGGGKRKNKLEKLIQKYELQESVELLPPTQKIEEEYRRSSIFAMTSRYEGLPLVLMEAMACGLPAVSYACKSGPKDLIKDGENGYLVNFRDEDAFAEKLTTLMENYELRKKMGAAARENILRFTEENIMPEWEKLFEELIKEQVPERSDVFRPQPEPVFIDSVTDTYFRLVSKYLGFSKTQK